MKSMDMVVLRIKEASGEPMSLMARPCKFGPSLPANLDCQIGNHDALVVNENEVCGSETQRLEQDRTVVLRLNVDDIRISDQDGFEGSPKHDGGPDAEFKADARVRDRDGRLGAGRRQRKSHRHDGGTQ
jgi:hypothetical protein